MIYVNLCKQPRTFAYTLAVLRISPKWYFVWVTWWERTKRRTHMYLTLCLTQDLCVQVIPVFPWMWLLHLMTSASPSFIIYNRETCLIFALTSWKCLQKQYHWLWQVDGDAVRKVSHCWQKRVQHFLHTYPYFFGLFPELEILAYLISYLKDYQIDPQLTKFQYKKLWRFCISD